MHNPAVLAAEIGGSELNRIASDPRLQVLIARYRRIERKYDIPTIIGSSDDGSICYIDRDLPDIISGQSEFGKFAVDPLQYLLISGQWLKALMDTKRYRPDEARRVASSMEARAIRPRIKSYPAYCRALQPYYKTERKIKSCPADLDIQLYDVGPILSAVKAAMAFDGKQTKEEARYSADGRPSKHCGGTWQWPDCTCKHFIKPDSCEKVRGYIEPTAICSQWTSHKKS